MPDTPVIDFDALETQVRAEADRKVDVLRRIVDIHTALTSEREAFLAADTDRVTELAALHTEATSLGFTTATLKPFTPTPLTPARSATRTRKRAPGRRSPAPVAGDGSTDTTANHTAPAGAANAGDGADA